MTKRQVLPVIYFVFRHNAGPASTRFGGFVRRLVKSGKMPEADYRTVALEELIFALDQDGGGAIYDGENNQVFHDASFVYFKSWEGMPEEASMVASYLHAKGIPFEDQVVKHAGMHKASQFWKLWAAGVPVVPTIVSNTLPSEEFLKQSIGNGPYLIKPTHGEKGRGVERLDTYHQLPKNLHGLVLQPFISNTGDYRVMTYGYTVRGALYRKASAGKIVNNTSQGAHSEYIEQDDVTEGIAEIAEKAARAAEHAIAGVDVIADSEEKLYVLEVNQGSQIVTGHYTDKKIAAFAEFIGERYEDRYTRKRQTTQLQPIGRHVIVNLPEIGIKNIRAKVDTGAYQSVVHASDIREYVDDMGRATLEYKVLLGHDAVKNKDISSVMQTTHDFTKATIKNSFGHRQTRYVVMLKIAVNGRIMRTGVTLTDRSDMAIPILLGRRFLRGRYSVNVELGKPKEERG